MVDTQKLRQYRSRLYAPPLLASDIALTLHRFVTDSGKIDHTPDGDDGICPGLRRNLDSVAAVGIAAEANEIRGLGTGDAP